jgi:hypothetical protein
LHGISSFCMQFSLKGILLPFAIALKEFSDHFASCRKEFDYHMQYFFIFVDFLDFACCFWQAAKRNLIHFRA